MFIMKSPISRSAIVDLDDQAHIKFALTALGYHDDTKEGLSPYSSEDMFDAIKRYQKANNLKVDGIINPDGETHTYIRQSLEKSKETAGAFKDFIGNYFDMRSANTKDADKYFHCKANYQATKRGWNGQAAAESLSNTRENIQRKFGEALADEIVDQTANHYGRNAAQYGDFINERGACQIFRPETLPEKY